MLLYNSILFIVKKTLSEHAGVYVCVRVCVHKCMCLCVTVPIQDLVSENLKTAGKLGMSERDIL